MRMRKLFAGLAALVVAATGFVNAPAAHADVDVYATPGVHLVNGRYWKTACSMYSSTVVRCNTDIFGTKVFSENGRWYKQNTWVFNNLSYLPSPRAQWADNPLATTGSWVSAEGRQWRSECDTPNTGRGACRNYIVADVASETGGVVKKQTIEVFNSMVRFSTATLPAVTRIPASAPYLAEPPAGAKVPLRAPSASAPAPKPPATSNLTASQQQAVRLAQQYLQYSSFSRIGLIEQLEYEKFSTADATFAVDYLKVDWNRQAVLTAEDYLEYSAFSRIGLIDQLEYEGFTTAQATYGVDRQGADWYQQAARMAQEYLDYMAFSRQGLIDQLIFEGFTEDQAAYGVRAVGL